MDYRNILTRAGWTFIQAAAAVLIVAGNSDLNLDVAKAAGIAGLAAVISFVKTVATEKLATRA